VPNVRIISELRTMKILASNAITLQLGGQVTAKPIASLAANAGSHFAGPHYDKRTRLFCHDHTAVAREGNRFSS